MWPSLLKTNCGSYHRRHRFKRVVSLIPYFILFARRLSAFARLFVCWLLIQSTAFFLSFLLLLLLLLCVCYLTKDRPSSSSSSSEEDEKNTYTHTHKAAAATVVVVVVV